MMTVEVCPHSSLTQEARHTSPACSKPNSVAAQEAKFSRCSETGNHEGLQGGRMPPGNTGT